MSDFLDREGAEGWYTDVVERADELARIDNFRTRHGGTDWDKIRQFSNETANWYRDRGQLGEQDFWRDVADIANYRQREADLFETISMERTLSL